MKKLMILPALVLAFSSCDVKRHGQPTNWKETSPMVSPSTAEVVHMDTAGLEDFEKIEIVKSLQQQFREKYKDENYMVALSVGSEVTIDETIKSMECLIAADLGSLQEKKVSTISISENHDLYADKEFKGEFVLQFWKGACKKSIEQWAHTVLEENKMRVNKDSVFKTHPMVKPIVGTFLTGKELLKTGAHDFSYEDSDVNHEHAIVWAQVYFNGNKYWVQDEDLEPIQ